MRELGWVGGDAHVHMIHGENQRPTGYADVATACRAGGLDWAYVNQEYTGAARLTSRATRRSAGKSQPMTSGSSSAENGPRACSGTTP